MRQLRIIRIFIATLFFVASAAYLMIGPHVHPIASISKSLQIIVSIHPIAIGLLLVWLILTILLGRIYCSTVCPVGMLSDIFTSIRKRVIKSPLRYRFKHQSRWSVHILLVYIICFFAGLAPVLYLLEPWQIMANISSVVNISPVEATWLNLGVGVGVAVLAGVISLVALGVYAMLTGRDYCTHICPYGTAMGLLHEHYMMHIEIDPDRCTYCGKCEENCKASCIKISERRVDNSRCVRCFDCLCVCNDNAINFQYNRNRPASPLFQRKSASSSN